MPDEYKHKLRDLANLRNLPIDWNEQTRSVSVGGQPFDTTGWENVDGRFMGTESMAQDFLKYQVPSANVQATGAPPMAKPEQTRQLQMPAEHRFKPPNYEPNMVADTPDYSSRINALTNEIGSAIQGFNKPYDLSNDPFYKQLAEYQQSQMLQMAGSRGMAMDSNTMARINQSNMLLGTQFQDRHDARQMQNIQNLTSKLGMVTGLEDRAMNIERATYGMTLTPQSREYMDIMKNLTFETRQFLDQYSDDYAAVIQQLSPDDPNRKLFEAARFQKVMDDPKQYRDFLIKDYGLSPNEVDSYIRNMDLQNMQMEGIAMAQDQSLYGMALTPQSREYINIMKNLTPEQRQFVQQYADNFAAAINEISPNDPNRKILEAARFQKVLADPVQFRDFLIQDYGLSPVEVDNIVINRKIEELQAQAINEKEQMELERLRLQIQKAFVDLEKAGFETQKSEIDAQKAYYESIIKQIEASTLPQKIQAQLSTEAARIQSLVASAEKSLADAERSRATTREIDQRTIEKMSKYTPTVQILFTDWVSSGQEFEKWLGTEFKMVAGDSLIDGKIKSVKLGETLSLGELQALIQLGKDTGRFRTDSKSNIESLTELFKTLGVGGE